MTFVWEKAAAGETREYWLVFPDKTIGHFRMTFDGHDKWRVQMNHKKRWFRAGSITDKVLSERVQHGFYKASESDAKLALEAYSKDDE